MIWIKKTHRFVDIAPFHPFLGKVFIFKAGWTLEMVNLSDLETDSFIQLEGEIYTSIRWHTEMMPSIFNKRYHMMTMSSVGRVCAWDSVGLALVE